MEDVAPGGGAGMGYRVASVVVVALAGLLLGSLGEWCSRELGGELPDLVLDASVGWAFLAVGLIAWWREPRNRIGALMIAMGLSWFLGNFEGVRLPFVFPLSYWLSALNLGFLVHLVLSFPDGRLDSRPARFVVVAMYVLVVVVGFADMATYDPAVQAPPNYLCGGACPPNDLLLVRAAGLFTAIHRMYYGAGIVLGGAALVLVVRRYVEAAGTARRLLTPAQVSLVAGATLLATTAAAAAGEVSGPLGTALVRVSGAAQLAVPLAFLLGLLRLRLARAAVGDVVIELGRSPSRARLRDALAEALDDRSLQLVFWQPEAGVYADAAGTPVCLPADDLKRMVTVIDHDGSPLAALVHDPVLARDPRLVLGLREAVRLGLENEQLHAEVQARLEEVEGWRRRMVDAADAADAERRRIERNLHDGAQQRLLAVSLDLGRALRQLSRDPDSTDEAAETIAGAAAELRIGLDELRELARGMHPAVLVQHGLREAVASVAESTPLRMRTIITADRCALLTESAAYYVVCEGVANAVRHARATRVDVTAHIAAGRLVVDVSDDGQGGATPGAGTGLRFLRERVLALDGRFEVRSPPGAGTRLHAELPCEPAAGDPG